MSFSPPPIPLCRSLVFPLLPSTEREAPTINQPLATADGDSVTLGSVCYQIELLCPQVTLTLPV